MDKAHTVIVNVKKINLKLISTYVKPSSLLATYIVDNVNIFKNQLSNLALLKSKKIEMVYFKYELLLVK